MVAKRRAVTGSDVNPAFAPLRAASATLAVEQLAERRDAVDEPVVWDAGEAEPGVVGLLLDGEERGAGDEGDLGFGQKGVGHEGRGVEVFGEGEPDEQAAVGCREVD